MWVIGPKVQSPNDQNPNAPGLDFGLSTIVPLVEIAELREGVGFATIRRIDRERAVTVTADTAPQVSPEFIMTDLEPELERLRKEHPGVKIAEGGRQRDFAKAFASLPMGMAAAVLMIYVILAWLFSSYVQPLIVMLAIPFGVIGVVWGHMLFGYRATFLSMIGFIALCGIVVNNSLILVEFYNAAVRSGMSVRDALVKAGRQRL
jgi:multidrug efflux pump subunit AcrB